MKALGLDDNKKVGMALMLVSIVSYFLGVLLLFDRTCVIVSNICFLSGMYFFIGFRGSFMFFRKKGTPWLTTGKRRGSVLYFVGLVMILFNLTFPGSLLQLVGFFIIFRMFLPDIYDSITRIPYVGKYLSTDNLHPENYRLQNFLDGISTNNRPSRI